MDTVVNVILKTQGDGNLRKLNQELGKTDNVIKKTNGQLGRLGLGFGKAGTSAKGASVGVKAFGTAVKSAFGPISAALAAIGGLTAAFTTIAGQDFAVAKLKTLGVETDALVGKLKDVSAELNGSASVAELTGAAYDVASAGFADAADNAAILKASALGAAGGFTDMNTAGNALTSVLNAYGLSADQATSVMDKFVQTQNDGKIVVAQYAQNIGKVASAAASLGVPLEEVNAAIAQSTASGVQADVAFTGLKGALARLASGEAANALKGTGVQIDAATVATDGLIGTLKKLKAAGLDTGQIFKALGTEAAPALLPLLNNLDKTDQLLRNQQNSAGTAAEAQKTATDTINGAWKRVNTVIQNFFTDQTAVGELLKALLNGLADSLNIIGKLLNVILAPFNLLIKAALAVRNGVQEITAAFVNALQQSKGFVLLQKLFAKMAPSLDVIGKILSTLIAPAFNSLIGLATTFADILGNVVYVVLDAMIQGLIKIGSIVPGLGDKAKELEEGWSEIKKSVDETVKPLEDISKETGSTAKEATAFEQSMEETLSFSDQLVPNQKDIAKFADSGFRSTDKTADAMEKVNQSTGLAATAAKSFAAQMERAAIAAERAAAAMRAAASSGGGGGPSGFQKVVVGGISAIKQTKAYASGGYVSGPQRALIGEAGPEYVIPANRMDSALANYAAGKRGNAVLSQQVNVTTGPVQQMDGTNYVTLQQATSMSQSAARQGAQMALTQIKTDPGTRRAIGVGS